MEKLRFDVNKHTWHPAPLLGQIVLVTTLNADGTSNIAPKSWISMMAFEPPILAIGCNLGHWTARNILARKEFVVNVVGEELVGAAWESYRLPHPRPVEAVGLTPIPALEVGPPRVEECRAHLECVLDRYLLYGKEVILLGRIVAVSVDEGICGASDPYAALRPIFYLEERTYGVVERARPFTGREGA